jgi:hypothetical protein
MSSLNNIETIATPPNTKKVPTNTRRYSSAPLPTMRTDRELLIAKASNQRAATASDTSE